MLFGAGLRTAGAIDLDQGCAAGTHVTLVARRAVTFLIDVNSAVTSLMRASEHGTFAVLRHSSLLASPASYAPTGMLLPLTSRRCATEPVTGGGYPAPVRKAGSRSNRAQRYRIGDRRSPWHELVGSRHLQRAPHRSTAGNQPDLHDQLLIPSPTTAAGARPPANRATAAAAWQ